MSIKTGNQQKGSYFNLLISPSVHERKCMVTYPNVNFLKITYGTCFSIKSNSNSNSLLVYKSNDWIFTINRVPVKCETK